MKIWIDNDEMKMPCGVCGEPHLEQLIQHEDARLRCESCWEEWASKNEVCPGCGEWIGYSKYGKCGECLQGERADHVYDKWRDR
jgi:predicted amidophosphoribosyltransferase